MKIQIPFQQLIEAVKALPPVQKAKLRKELSEDVVTVQEKDEFIEFLLNGPVYSENDIEQIEENRKSISAWRINF